jgi:hypothetical protein
MTLLARANRANLALMNQFVLEITEVEEKITETWGRVIGVNNANATDVFEVADMFLTLTDVFEYYLHECTPEQFIEWYWWDLDNKQTGKKTMNLKHFLISKKSKK